MKATIIIDQPPSRGDVFSALLDPTRGSEQAGTRPVIIVSRNAINHNSTVVVCVPCTDAANCRKIYPSQALLRRGIGGLDMDSVAMCEQIRAVTVQRLQRRMGTLDAESLKDIEEKIKVTLDLE